MQALTIEQLQQLEGMERANVEARLTLLRDVQKLLDSAVLRLNQYSTVMAALRWAWSFRYLVSVVYFNCIFKGHFFVVVCYFKQYLMCCVLVKIWKFHDSILNIIRTFNIWL